MPLIDCSTLPEEYNQLYKGHVKDPGEGARLFLLRLARMRTEDPLANDARAADVRKCLPTRCSKGGNWDAVLLEERSEELLYHAARLFPLKLCGAKSKHLIPGQL